MQRIQLGLWFLTALLLSACGSRGGDPILRPAEQNADNQSDQLVQTSGISPPKNLTVVSLTPESITLAWEAVAEADAYQLYYAQEPIRNVHHILELESGGWVSGIDSPHTLKGLDSTEFYYFVVTAIHAERESPPSNMLQAELSPPPTSQAPSPEEVRMIELVNRARFDPLAELARHPKLESLNEGLAPESIEATPKAPLAFNSLLAGAARNHSLWMLETGRFSHTGNGGNELQQRIDASGYGLTETIGENISVRGYRQLEPARLIQAHHDTLFRSPSHRINILRDSFRELGVAQELGVFTFDVGTFSSSMLTQNFASRANSIFLTGVIYHDKNGNAIYDISEGVPGALITVNGKVHQAYDSGIYSIPIQSNRQYHITISGPDLPNTVHQTLDSKNRNIKLDLRVTQGKAIVKHW